MPCVPLCSEPEPGEPMTEPEQTNELFRLFAVRVIFDRWIAEK